MFLSVSLVKKRRCIIIIVIIIGLLAAESTLEDVSTDYNIIAPFCD